MIIILHLSASTKRWMLSHTCRLMISLSTVNQRPGVLNKKEHTNVVREGGVGKRGKKGENP